MDDILELHPEGEQLQNLPNPFQIGKTLCCHKCGEPFISNHSFFIKIDEPNHVTEEGIVYVPVFTGNQTENLICVPCLNKRNNIDPETRNKERRAKFGLEPNIKRIVKKEKKSKKKSDSQPSLF